MHRKSILFLNISGKIFFFNAKKVFKYFFKILYLSKPNETFLIEINVEL